MSPTTSLTFSFVVGIILILRGIWLNRELGGNWGDMPWRYRLTAKIVFFAGIAVIILGNVVVRFFR